MRDCLTQYQKFFPEAFTLLSQGKHLEAYPRRIICPITDTEYHFVFQQIEGLVKYCPGCGKKLTKTTMVWHSLLKDMISIEEELRK